MKLFNRVSHRIRSQSRKRPPVRLSFDLFEERLLLTTFTVNSNADTNTGTGNTGTLRYVINQLDASTDLTNTIDFDIPRPWGANDQPGLTTASDHQAGGHQWLYPAGRHAELTGRWRQRGSAH